MIFITVGSTKFDKLIKKVDLLIEKKIIKEKVIAQTGNGDYIPRNIKWFRFTKTLIPYYRKSKLVISHEGAGTLFEIVNLNKKGIVLTNPETVTNPDLIKKLSAQSHLLWCKDINQLERFLKLSKKFKPKKYKIPKCNINKVIEKSDF